MELATAVVGLVGVGAQISSLLGQFISGCANAPALVRVVHHEINDFNSILSLLQPLLLGSSPLNQSRASMVYVDHLALTLTGCVCTLSEMEKEVNGLKPIGRMRTWDRLKWSRMEPTISQLFQRLLSHKSSLTLTLTILTSTSLAGATSCSVTLREQLSGGIPHMPSSSSAVAGLGLTVGHLDSTMGNSDSTMGDSDSTIGNADLAVDISASIMTVTDTWVPDFHHLACESILFTTRPYRGMSNDSVISLESSQRPKPSWSLISEGSNRSVLSLPVSDYEFSGLSLAGTSDMSTLPLPISADKVRNWRWYGGNTATPSLISTPNKGGVLRLFASRNKIPPQSLHQAAMSGQVILIKLLLEQGADIEAKDKSGDTALHVAARNNRVSSIGLLLDRGADMEAKSQIGEIPLHNASFYGHDSIVELLLDRGADMEAKGQNGKTPLHNASWNGHNSTVGLLLGQGADVGAKAHNRVTPLHHASLNGHDSTVGLLLDRGVDVGAKAQNGATSLHNAALKGHDPTVRLLLDRGADIEAKTQSGVTPFHNAARKSTFWLLLDWEPDKLAKAQNGKPHSTLRGLE